MTFQRILITGASSGLGAELARQLAGPDVTVVLVGRNIDRLEQVAEASRDKGATAHAVALDISDPLLGQKLAELDRRYQFDLVIAAAGIAAGKETTEIARQITATNVIGVQNTVDAILPGLIERGRGQIGLISSLAGFRALGGPPAYSASKAWVRLFGEALRGRLARKGIGVSVICPGFVDTPMVDDTTRAKLGQQLVAVDQAAALTIKALKHNRARLSFPRAMAFRVWWLAAQPAWLSDRRIKRHQRAAQTPSGQE